ncbi:hypothetical protein CEUSTIGMA_g9047.t1 [Chlamydomonas eustigma]|uniref:Uncharacterized protein n=1 Tax=Chlamydomonas eustigma TaxID=1157962 RepID=A0A250XFD5_9CHLO|nr:hypothetical protein CEUSTIGMA_g9047.t1 [Chlamydomonas eustigma]|eukprot:GAX81619.1 hypothetical protein CEUSTIGMA_g9047.t1 [Chlamydomonas eustigma]
MSLSSLAARPIVEGVNGVVVAKGAKDALFKKLQSRGRKWFDSGEYFLAKEGLSVNDLIPGGAPVQELLPKLAPTARVERGASTLHRQLISPHGNSGYPLSRGVPSTSDY